ncbi:outer membrane protein assembly factor BamE [Opacimonas viscosa]|uniref:Outer membrane protein assembly factor BamE n=1 Tax=Opacimonas viscosa TaxID=2961944 RepID=A0AA41X0K2_9ALTE|nr:outer membrane protein assembly factor BamE [Opacimonas viscosa]MCP3427682.1 outer membrane protein assembly factor BamE [Opacimonas viscosa]
MKSLALIFVLISTLSLSACSNWIFRIDIPQGNFLDKRDVEKLRIEMTKEQVEFVLGKPVVNDMFNDDKWYYIYEIKRGMQGFGKDLRKELILEFTDNKLTSATGDFELSEEFNTPLN